MYKKAMRISNVNIYISIVWGFYGSSIFYNRVLKRKYKISLLISSNKNMCIGHFGCIYMSSMTNFYLNYVKIFNTLNTSLRILISFFYVLLISSFDSDLAEKTVKIYIYTLTSILRFSEFLLKTKYVKLCPRLNIAQKFIEDCADRLQKIEIYKKNKKYIGLTREFLTDPNFLVLAYLQIKSNSYNILNLVDKETLDGINKNWFINAAKKIDTNSYKFKPVKFVEIFKFNSEKFRPLTMGSPKDKSIQKAISIIINQIYEYKDQTFLDVSHGFRPGRSTHTVLKEVKTKWTGLYWFLKAEIEKVFEKIQHDVLINLLNKKIKDQRLTDFIRKMFNCRVFVPSNFDFKNNMGISRSNVLSPLLCNIYFHELDVFMTNLIIKYYKGKFPTVNQEYYKKLELNKYERTLTNEIQNSIKRDRRRQLFNKGIKSYLHDGNYIRMRYIRYANDFLVGIRAPKPVAKKIKTEITNWLKMTLHLNLNEKKTNLTYVIGNKIKFLGFSLYYITYNQMPIRNSRRIEKFKRVKKKIIAHKKVIEKRLSKRVRIDLIKIIKKKLKIRNKKSTKKVVHELSDTLINILGDEGKVNSKYREILRELESKLTEVIVNDTNENIKKILGHLINPKLLDLSEINENLGVYSMQRDTNLISRIKLSETEFIRRFTKLLKTNGYEHYKNRDLKKIRFDKTTIKYLRNNNIKFTYYPMKVILPEKIKNKLIKTSKNSPKRSAFTTNYKTLINYFWKEQNKVDSEMRITKEQSHNLIVGLKAFESYSGIRINLPIKIKVNWDDVVERLKIKGFLNKKGRPASVMRLTTLEVVDMIKYFRSVLHGYLCALDINLWTNESGSDSSKLYILFTLSINLFIVKH